MRTDHRLSPLDAAALDRLALRYVERFATTQGKLADYLRRKVRERGWSGPPADPDAVAARMAELGYVDDRAFADARATAMARRGLGARRVEAAFRAAFVAEADAAVLAPVIAERAAEAALLFARRKRIGPWRVCESDRAERERQLARMLRAGHPLGLSRRIVAAASGEELDPEALA